MIKRIASISIILLISIVSFGQDIEIPKDYKFVTAEDYQPYESRVKAISEWALNTPLEENEVKRKEAYAFVMAWLTGTPNVTVEVHADKINLFDVGNMDLLFPFMLGWTIYSLDNDYSKDKILCNKAGIEAAVQFYEKNKKSLKKNKGVEKYAKLIKKGKLEEELKKTIQ